MSKKLERITTREEDFNKWYTDIVKQSNLVNYGLVKGTIMLSPYSTKIWNLIQNHLNEEFEKIGVKQVIFPTLLPLSSFEKEKEQIDSFNPELFKVTELQGKKLKDPLVLRPTSEILFSHYFKSEIINYKDLPIMLNQWTNVFRLENNTRPFLRNSEFYWQEGHTCHITDYDSNYFALKILDIYKDFINNKLLISTYNGKKSNSEKFPAAKTTYTIEAITQNGYALQSATSHDLGKNFSNIYDVSFFDKDNTKKYVYQSSWGLSTRIIGAIIMAHSDDNGLVLPPFIAPIQIEIITISVNKNLKILDFANSLKKDFIKSGIRVSLNDKDISFGKKAAMSEIRGIPIRIEIGPNLFDKEKATVFRRDNFEKIDLKLSKILNYSISLIPKIEENLKLKSNKYLLDNTIKAKNKKEFYEIFNKKNVFVETNFLMDDSIEKKIKQDLGVTVRVVLDKQVLNQKCFYTEKTANCTVIWARSY